jgi:hypothetical protein
MIKHHLAQDVLTGRGGGRPTPLQPDDAAWAAERSERIVDGLAAAGYEIVGTLDDLRVTPTDLAVEPPPEPSAEEQLEIAVEAIAAILLRISRLRRKVIRP